VRLLRHSVLHGRTHALSVLRPLSFAVVWTVCERVRELILGRHIRIGRQPGPHMPCGWGCGAKLTNGQMQRHFTNCPRRPTVQETIRHLPRKPNRGGRPRGPRMPCGWHCGAKLTASEMRRHFAHCSRRPKASAGGVYLERGRVEVPAMTPKPKSGE